MTHYATVGALALALAGCRSEQARPASTRSAAAPSAQPPSVTSAVAVLSTVESRSVANLTPLTRPEHRRLALGGNHSCFIDRREKLWCWGANDLGEIGDGQHGWQGRSEDTDEEARVVERPFGDYPFERTQSVYAAGGRTCATVEDALWCWGGHGPKPMSVVDRPVRQPGIAGGIQDVALSAHECALVGGRLSCWGNNRSGAVGGSDRDEAAPLRTIAELGTGVLAVATSTDTTCAAKADHTVWCWGGNDFAERGEPKGDPDARPRQVANVEAIALGAGGYHFCALRQDHALQCCGQANHHQLGNPLRAMSGIARPQTVRVDPAIVQVVANAGTTLVLLRDGSVMAWGENAFGLLGLAERNVQTPTPTRIGGLERIV